MKNDWEIKKLGDVCQIRPSKNETTKFLKDDDNVSFFPMEDLQIMNYYIEPKQLKKLKEVSGSYTCFANGDVLLAKVTPCFENGKLGIANNLENGVGFGSSEYIAFRPSNVLLSEYLYYSLATPDFRENGKKHLLGACGLKRLSKDYVNEYEIPVPPLEEQKRIVKILDEKFAQLESLKANVQTNLQNAKDLFQSQLTKTFSNTTWEKKRLGDCGTFKNGMNFAATDTGYTIRSLGVGDFKDRYCIDDTETLSEISLKAAPSEDYLLHDGDIVFVRSNGNKELVGRCVLVYPKDIPTTYSGFCIRFRKDFDLLDADFLLHFMKAESSRKILNGKEGANISNLNQKILGDFEVPLPPLPEQKRIVKELDTLSEKVRQLQEIYTKQIANCDELKQFLLQKAFEGEL